MVPAVNDVRMGSSNARAMAMSSVPGIEGIKIYYATAAETRTPGMPSSSRIEFQTPLSLAGDPCGATLCAG
jgi:hypothetical protein